MTVLAVLTASMTLGTALGYIISIADLDKKSLLLDYTRRSVALL